MQQFLNFVLFRRNVTLVVKTKLRAHTMEGSQKQLKLYI